MLIILFLSGTLAYSQLTVTIESATTSPTSSSPIQITITFSGGLPVTGFELADISVVNGTVSNFNNSSNPIFTVDITPGSEGIVTIDIAENVVEETNSVASQFSILYDITAPNVTSIVRKDAAPELTNAASVDFTVSFDEPVTGVTIDNFSLSGLGATGASISTVSGSDDERFVTVITGNDGGLELNLSVVDGIKDAAGNVLAETHSGDEGYLVDRTAPGIPTVTGPTLTNNAKPTWEWSQHGVNPGNGIFRYGYAEGTWIEPETTNTTFTPDTDLNSGTHTLFVQEQDDAGNWSLSGSHAIEVDLVPPAAPSINGIVDGSFTVNQQFTLTGVEAEATAQYSLDDGATWEVYSEQVTLSLDGEYNVVAYQTDKAGNDSPPTATITVIIDRVTETPSLLSPISNSYINADIELGFELPEDAAAGSVKITFSTPDKVDRVLTLNNLNGFEEQGIHYLTLNGEKLDDNPNVQSYTGYDYLIDGLIYTVKVEYQDVLGNSTATATNVNIQYSSTNPEASFSAISPNPTNIAVGDVVLNFTKYVKANEVTYNDFNLTRDGEDVTLNNTLPISHNSDYYYNTYYSNPFTLDLTGYTEVDGNYELTLVASGSGIVDWYGNPIQNNATVTWTMDGTPPTLLPVTISSNNANPSFASVDDEIMLYFEANEVIIVNSVSIGGMAADVFNLNGNKWLAFITVPSDFAVSGEVPFEISCTDMLGNTSIVTQTSNESKVIFDVVPPQVINATVSDGLYGIGQNLDLVLTFNEKVLVSGVPSVSCSVGENNLSAAYISGSGTSNLTFRYTVVEGDLDADGVELGDVILLNGGSIHDLAGNDANLSYTPPLTSNVKVDGVRPVVISINTLTPAQTITNANSLVYRATFSENVSGVGVDDFTLAKTGSATGLVASVSAATGTVIDVTLTDVSGDGTIRLNLKDSNTGIIDNAANAIAGGFTTGQQYTVDNTPPTVLLSDIHSGALVKKGDAVIIRATFTEANQIKESLQPVITISEEGISTAMARISNLEWEYEWTVSSEGNGDVQVTIQAYDLAGNECAPATGKTAYTLDNTPPSLVTLSILSDQTNAHWAKAESIVTITFTSTEPIKNLDATILGNPPTTLHNVSGNSWQLSYTIAGDETLLGVDKEVDFSIAFEDLAGNAALYSQDDVVGLGVTLDITPPVLSPVTINSDHSNPDRARVGSLITVQVEANETIERVTATVNGRVAIAEEFDALNHIWHAYYYMRDADVHDTDVAFSFTCYDLAGNISVANDITSGSKLRFDKVKPTIGDVTISSNNSVSPLTHTALNDDVTISFSTSEDVEDPVVLINGRSGSVVGGGQSWTASRSMDNDDVEGIVTFTIDVTDKAGNESATKFTTDDGTSIVFDKTPPQIISAQVNHGVYKVNDLISIAIQADNSNYSATTPTVNGYSAVFTNNSNTTYTVSYTVEEGHSDLSESAILPAEIELQDKAGNTTLISQANVNSGSIVIDANTPQVNLVESVSTPGDHLKVGDEIAFTLTLETPETGLSVQPSTYNGKPIVWVADGTGATYTATYVVANGDQSHDSPPPLDAVTVTDAAGNVSAPYVFLSIEDKPIYASNPTATITGTTTKCDDGVTTPILFEFVGYPPFALTYSNGTDVVGPINVPGLSYEIEVESGEYTIVNLVDSKGNATTTALQEAIITVNPLPLVSLNIIGSLYNVNDPRVDLKPYASPAGGVFSGDGVSANGFFYPSMIEVDGDDQIVPITYTYTDVKGCQNSATQNVAVSTGGAVVEGVQSSYCQYDLPVDVLGKNPNSIVGWFDIPTSAYGWVDHGNNTLTISPQEFFAGEHTIMYYYVDGGTTFDAQRTFMIDSVGANIDFGPLLPSYCSNDNVVSIQAQNLYPSGGSGFFTGPPSGFGTQTGSNQATFEPSMVNDFDETYEISYYYQSPRGCVSKTVTKEVVVNSVPVLDFSIRDNYNYNEAPVTLSGNFSGGVFSATGGIVVDNILYPNRRDPGSINITYYYQDPITGCSNSLVKPSRIREATEVIEGLDNVYCYSKDIINISSQVTDDALLIGEFISDKGGIVSVSGNTAEYSIAEAGNGTDRVTFRYIIGETPYEVSTTVLIDSIGPVSITGLAEHYCADSKPVEIRGYLENALQGTRSLSYTGDPSAFSSTGSVATLSPALETPDSYDVTFEFTSVASGCSRDTTYSFDIHPLPLVSTTIPDYYNVDAEPLILQGFPAGGLFTAERGVSGNEFYPAVAGAGAHNILYTYSDEYGCVNSSLHSIVVVGADGEISMPNFACIDSNPITITATTGNGLVGEFIGKGIANTGDGEATFDPAIAGKGVHNITYKYLFAADGVTELFLSRNIEVDSLGLVEIFGLEDVYCHNDPSTLLTASPAGGIFTNTEYLVVNRFYPSLASTESLNPVSYTFTNNRTGCSITGAMEVDVRPVPKVRFNVEQSCSDLQTDPVQFVNNTESIDAVSAWQWSFDSQGFATSTEENPNYLYLTSGSKQVTLIATTTFGCQTRIDSIVNIGLVPKANFTRENECFNNREVVLVSTVGSASIVNYRWELSDGTTYEGESLNTIGHMFPAVDTYDVKLVITSKENCKDSIVKAIRILPLIKFDAVDGSYYFENFESNDGNWLARGLSEGDTYSWRLGHPNGDIINSPSSGENAWFTDVDLANQAVEQSQVVSPCFDLSGLQRPMMKLGIWSSPVAGRNGAVVQYSIDDGKAWVTLGEQESGINWYNSSSIQSQPGGQITGWSRDAMDSWATARHSLDELKGKTNVRFRIAFAADGLAIDYFDGFAFDDVWIGNREQNLLVEYFTNTTLLSTAQANTSMVLLEDENELDVVPIHYHTDSPYGDPIFELYPSGISARQLYYGVTGIPYALVNGTEEFNFTSFEQNQTNIVNIERLKDPVIGISVHGTASNSLDITLSIEALEPIDNQELVVHCAVVQKLFVLDQAMQGQDEFSNVIRQFIPDPGGTWLKSNWSKGDKENLSLSWPIPPQLNKEQLSVVVFVQNALNHKVYQVQTVKLSDISTSSHLEQTSSISLYPNPATSSVRLVSPSQMEQITIIDASGRVLRIARANSTQVDIDVNALKPGMYIVHVKHQGGFEALKFVKK
ncbi:MAG: T9SS type A sorting domain-containing protein [Tenuifilaceae bacterium]|nr:T9SS type A sorting domain-containing protein [Tenuifilaceae bacterium]